MSHFLSLEASQLHFAASAACHCLIKTACRISPSTLIGEDEACWQQDRDCCVIAGFLLDPAVTSVVKALRAPFQPLRSKKESDTDLSTNLKGIDEVAHTKINMFVEQIHKDFSSSAHDLQR